MSLFVVFCLNKGYACMYVGVFCVYFCSFGALDAIGCLTFSKASVCKANIFSLEFEEIGLGWGNRFWIIDFMV